jgi:hypothetical protein
MLGFLPVFFAESEPRIFQTIYHKNGVKIFLKRGFVF